MRRFIGSKFVILLLAVALMAALTSSATACPTCGEAIGHQDAAHNGVAKGFYYSILFMMGMPYLLLGTFCGCMYWKVRRARAARALKDNPAREQAAADRDRRRPWSPNVTAAVERDELARTS